jgi:hypothetical protein
LILWVFAGNLDPWPADDKAVGVAGHVALQMWLEVPSATPLEENKHHSDVDLNRFMLPTGPVFRNKHEILA